MLEIRMRPKHQVTLLAHIVREANLQVDDRMAVHYLNGNIVSTPKKLTKPFDVMAYAGVGRGAWGGTPEAVTQTIRELRAQLVR